MLWFETKSDKSTTSLVDVILIRFVLTSSNQDVFNCTAAYLKVRSRKEYYSNF